MRWDRTAARVQGSLSTLWFHRTQECYSAVLSLFIQWKGDEITMLYQIIGEGTQRLSEMPTGASLQVLGPLGNTFNLTDQA